MRALFIGLLCLTIAPTLRAQPAGVTRVLRTFDFEERRLNNPEDLPMYWRKVQGPGLPHYVNGFLTSDRARGGQYSFRIDLNGGGAIYRYPAGLVPVQTGAHYRVEGFVQTTVLANARARITAYFCDEDLRAIASSVRHSEVYSAARPDAPWQPLHVELSADDSSARWLVIEMGLLQPAQYAPTSLGQRTLFTQDIRGSAWFDDITVSQVPQVALRSDRPGNIFRPSDPLCVHVVVNDRFVDDLAAQLVITDAGGRIVFQRSGALDVAVAESVGPADKKMSLMLPQLRAGWYSAELIMTSQGHFVARERLDLVLLADDAPRVTPDPRFGVIATDVPLDGWGDLPDILCLLGAGRIKLPVWSSDGDVQNMDSAAFGELLERFTELGIEPTACLIDLPPDLRDKLNGGSWSALLTADRQLWQQPLAYLVVRHVNHLHRWQLGADGSDAFVNDPKMREAYKLVYREFAALIEKPDLAMPWPAWYELDGDLPATIALHVKPEVLPSQLPMYLQDLRQRTGQNLSIYLDPLDRSQYGREVQIRDLAQRFVYALSADAKRIDIRLPFDISTATGVEKQPQELFLIVRTLMTLLGGTTFRGKVPVAEGIEAFLFDQSGKGILVIWDRGISGGVKPLAINLAENATRVDLWGNSTPLLRSNDDRAGGGVRIDVGPMPIFIVGVDGALAQLRASVALDNPLVESSFKAHTRKLRFVNPYRQAISGSFKLVAPKGWVINPPTGNFSLNPDETFEREITIEFPYSSFAGPKTIQAEFQVQSDTNSSFTVPVTLKLGLSDVGLQTLALRDGKDVIVQQMITNSGERPIDYTSFALYPGQARQERLVTNLAPGRTTIKKYRFTNITFTPDTKIRTGLRELNGTRILNDEVAIQ